MGFDEGTSNGDGTECSEGPQCLKSDAVNNGARLGIGTTDVAGWSSGQSEGFRTYKRRKHANSCSESSKLQDDGRAYVKPASQLGNQPLKEPQGVVVENNSCEQIRIRSDGLGDCSQRPSKIVLEHMYQSLSNDKGGMQGCIRDALEFCSDFDGVARAKDYDYHDENRRMCTSSLHLLNGFQKEASGRVGVVSNGHLDSLNHHSVTEMCRHACFNVLISEKFTSLCKLLLENFQGAKIDKLFDFTLINSRMKDGVYDNTPLLFLSDIQQVWGKLQEVGAEMVSIAKNLSNISRSCYNKQFSTWESDSHTKVELGEDCSAYRACTCRRCGDKADGRDCLVCDSCEEMYHVSCIEPAVQEIPPKSWYCAFCTASGIQTPHENCMVCERLNKTVAKGVGNASSCTNEENLNELDDNSNCGTDEGFQQSERSKSLGLCKICECEIQDGEKLKICSHSFCPSRFYHTRCLAKKQLKSYGPDWYCPSCLCRSCLTDKDDDKIVLCDGCDHAYHIYCMKPEQTSIPKGQWFCRSCDLKLQAVKRAKRNYENSEKWKSKGGGGMEMLLTAVNTLNYEENLAGI
ncbi:Autoimmune regulator [Parasponia andersonii]|uniref:Autoimmune regulator n=1 Tax=Parasponia andersonii TaxID=3476 RepID=A0A2P5CGD6_PARAD|nr:Autoimmune regulator [Parasponia andersonii]